jgi:hypothetical protein
METPILVQECYAGAMHREESQQIRQIVPGGGGGGG